MLDFFPVCKGSDQKIVPLELGYSFVGRMRVYLACGSADGLYSFYMGCTPIECLFVWLDSLCDPSDATYSVECFDAALTWMGGCSRWKRVILKLFIHVFPVRLSPDYGHAMPSAFCDIF
ncbi:hypothetical protein HS088_TW03G00220 [Tripterygium wilfordii]|uniref:Uncharacterized protein n=1 Tax=Tripterygium wilfordii TaxID=458696 RepID=A0A7J7DUB9_TRIWF|nr:hypothetical protein HS088_TW03G00220 [Tripterygium wilfordii]